MDLRDPVTAATLVADALERAGIPHALYGGLLLAAYGEARETRDADIAVVDVDAGAIRAALDAAAIATHQAFTGMKYGGLLLDRFTLLGGRSTSGLNTLDVVRPRSARYRAAAIDRSVVAPLRDSRIRVLIPEDFVLFKVLSTRDRDLDDAASVLGSCGGHMDMDLVRSEAAALAIEIPDHDVSVRWALVERIRDRDWK